MTLLSVGAYYTYKATFAYFGHLHCYKTYVISSFVKEQLGQVFGGPKNILFVRALRVLTNPLNSERFSVSYTTSTPLEWNVL